jgi:hypothetical protein
LDKPLHVTYKVSKLAYRIWVILIANKRVKNFKVNEDLSLDKPLHVIYKVSKLAYRIWVILIANERVKKKSY